MGRYRGEAIRGSEWSCSARLRLVEFAKKYPRVPLLELIDCLLAADREAAAVTDDAERNLVAGRLAVEGLERLNGANV